MNPYLKLMRPEQWYKNALVFLALFFSNNLLNKEMLSASILGFVSLSLVSSSYYIINDLRDAGLDRMHPHKKSRPLASGTANPGFAKILSMLLLLPGLALAYKLSPAFFLFPAALFASSTLYSLYLKKIAILDIHVVALNFLLRAISGAVLISVVISPWLVLSMFLVALFLAIGKRLADRKALGASAKKFGIYSVYTEEFLRGALYILAAATIVSYGLYAFLAHENSYLVLTIPFVSFVCLRFVHFSLTGSARARSAHLLFLDRQILAALVLLALISFSVLYLA